MAGTDQTCHGLISMALKISILRVGREHKECLLQSWHLMCAINLGLEKWNDMLMFQHIASNEDDQISSLHSTGFYPTANQHADIHIVPVCARFCSKQ